MMGKIITGAFAIVGVAATAAGIAGLSALIGGGFIADQVEKDGRYELKYVTAEERKKSPGVYFRVKEVSETVEVETE